MKEAYAVLVPRGYRIGDWEVRRPIATGAFGSVYEARRTGARTGPHAGSHAGSRCGAQPETAALKFLPTGTGTPRRLAHLRELVDREVTLHRRLSRPRLIRMYETLTVDDPAHPELDGATVLVLEKAEGSLSTLLTAGPRPAAGPELLAQICEGLAQLHRAGWVHGDLKPANVLLMRDGSARLADFNTAAELEGTHAYSPAFSTPDYTPPELLWSEVGVRGRQVRPSADVWAFGVLAHLTLTGSFPLPGGTPSARRDSAAAYARGSDELRLSSQLPYAWRDIVCACLTRTHADRIGTESLLRRVAAATGTTCHSPLPQRLRRYATTHGRRTRLLLGGTAVTAAVAALGFGIGSFAHAPPDVRASTALPAAVAPATYGAAELRTDRGVPPSYRPLIVNAAHDCPQPEVTPALIAAMLKAESDFDPALSDPAKDEYGIARWTPRVLRYWIRADGEPAATTPVPPFSAAVSIPAMGRYLCFIAPNLEPSLPGDRRMLVAAAYRTSFRKVNNTGGVPPEYRDYCARVARYLKEYTPAGRT
ncbi:protein kinase domain-containing protein [Streptomyces seoulensis]